MNKSMLKKAAIFGLAGVMAVAAGCGSNKDAGNANSNEAKIALLTTTTGGAAAYGESIKAGAELAVSEINADANAVKINLLVEDTKGDKNEAINAMNKVISKDKVVAVIGPMLSGEMMAAGYGESIKAGAELAVSEINADANAVKINLLVEDTKGDKNEAINAMNKVISKDKVVAVIGPMLSGEMMAAGPVANKSKIVALGTSTTAEGITDIGDYIVQIVDTETFADKDTDFSAQLTKIQQAKPDVIVVASLYQEGALIMKKMREMGMNQPVIGSNGFNSPEFIKIAGAAADGVIVGTPWFPNKDDQKVKDFRKAYKDKYGKEPDQFAAQAYDAVYLYEAALKKAGSTTDREKFREALKNIADFVGVTGQFKFNEKRDPSMEVQVLQIKNGQISSTWHTEASL